MKRKRKAKEMGKIHATECRASENSRGDKKALCEQCKEIEENNRMGKTRDLFQEIRKTKGTFHAKMGKKKFRNSIDLYHKFLCVAFSFSFISMYFLIYL